MKLWTVDYCLWSWSFYLHRGMPVTPRCDLWKGTIPAIYLGEEHKEDVLLKVNPRLILWQENGYWVESGQLVEEKPGNFRLEPEKDHSSEALVLFSTSGRTGSRKAWLMKKVIGWTCIPDEKAQCPNATRICNLRRPEGLGPSCGSSRLYFQAAEEVEPFLLGFIGSRSGRESYLDVNAVFKMKPGESVFVITFGQVASSTPWAELLYDGKELVVNVYNTENFSEPVLVEQLSAPKMLTSNMAP